MKRIYWFLFIVIIGLIPFFLRLLVFLLISLDENVFAFLINETDFIFFGFIVNVINLKELSDINLSSKILGDTIINEKRWIVISYCVSLFCIIIYSSIIFLLFLDNLDINIYINLTSIKIISILLGIISVIFGFTIIDRVNNIENQIFITSRKL